MTMLPSCSRHPFCLNCESAIKEAHDQGKKARDAEVMTIIDKITNRHIDNDIEEIDKNVNIFYLFSKELKEALGYT